MPTLRDRGAVRHDTVDALRWTVDGTAKVAKDVRVEDARIRGLVSVGGQLSGGALTGRGTLEVAGAIEFARSLVLKGDLKAGSTLRAGSLEIEGSVRSIGPITVDRQASVEGLLECSALTAGVAQVAGGARIPDRVNAATFDARLRTTSSFGTIVGRSVRVRGKIPNVVDKAFFHECDVTVDRIEAEVVDLEGVEVAFVRAPEVTLGRYCHVTEIDGTIVRQHPSSHVGPESRTPPPFGLRR